MTETPITDLIEKLLSEGANVAAMLSVIRDLELALSTRRQLDSPPDSQPDRIERRRQYEREYRRKWRSRRNTASTDSPVDTLKMCLFLRKKLQTLEGKIKK